MIYAVRGGHNFQCPGANGIIEETKSDRDVKDAMIKYFKLDKDNVVDCTPGNCSENTDLVRGTNASDSANANFYLPVHFNSAENNSATMGSEVWLNPNNKSSVAMGYRILAKLSGLGFKNRGIKDGVNAEHLHDIKAPKASSILIEVCFVGATGDVALYKKLGPDVIGKAIVEGVVGHAIGTATPVELFTVRLNWEDAKSQIFSSDNLYKAKDVANLHPGYKVFDSKGGYRYMLAVTPAVKPVTKEDPFRVVAGSFENESGADKQIEDLKKLGVDSFKTQH